MFLSQGLLAFASGMFLGPLLITGIGKALRNGPNYLVSFIVLFTMTQSLGGLAAPALFGTYQVVREEYHSSHLTEQVVPSDPRIAQRLQAQSQALAPRQSDPQLRQAQSAAQLSQATTREANVLAFNDVFRLIGMLAIGVFGWTLYHTLRLARQNRNAPPP